MWQNVFYFNIFFEEKKHENISWIVLHKFVKLNYVELKIILFLLLLHSVES